MGLTAFLLEFFVKIIENLGYTGVFVLMTFESMILPVPSEAVMPFAGFLWHEGAMSFWPIIIFSTLGSILGSFISYAIGKYGGRPFVLRFGKYLLLNEHHLESTERFFQRFGEKAIFFSRFIPVVRHFISIPAGVGNMRIGKFTVYTVIGAGMWNACLAYIGFKLGEEWERVRSYGEVIDIILVVLIVAALAYFITKRVKEIRGRKVPTQ